MAKVTLNPNDKGMNIVLSNGELTAYANGNSSYQLVRATHCIDKGKWYWEVKKTGGNNNCYGICTKNEPSNGGYGGSTKYGVITVDNNGGTYYNNIVSDSSSANMFATNDIIGIALDMDNGKITWYKNGTFIKTWVNNIKTAIGTSVYASVGLSNGSSANINFGDTPFVYNIPEGYKPYTKVALNYKTIIKSNNQYFSIKPENYNTATKNFKPLTLNGGTFPNKLDFNTYGIDDLNILANNMTIDSETFKPISKFSKIQFIIGIDDLTTINIENNMIATPQGKLITPKNPRLLPMNIKKLNKLTVTSNITGNSIVKYAVSFDGIQYKIWNGTVWENIDLTIDNVKNKGMSIIAINNINAWETIRNGSNKIWLAKYMELDLSTDKCEIDKEEINFDENGYWRSLNSTEMATHPVTYGKNENNLFDSATVTNNSGNSENLMITSLSFVTTTDTKFKTFSVIGSNDLNSSVENGTLTFNSKNKTIKMVSDDATDTIDFDIDINTLPTF